MQCGECRTICGLLTCSASLSLTNVLGCESSPAGEATDAVSCTVAKLPSEPVTERRIAAHGSRSLKKNSVMGVNVVETW